MCQPIVTLVCTGDAEGRSGDVTFLDNEARKAGPISCDVMPALFRKWTGPLRREVKRGLQKSTSALEQDRVSLVGRAILGLHLDDSFRRAYLRARWQESSASRQNQ